MWARTQSNKTIQRTFLAEFWWPSVVEKTVQKSREALVRNIKKGIYVCRATDPYWKFVKLFVKSNAFKFLNLVLWIHFSYLTLGLFNFICLEFVATQAYTFQMGVKFFMIPAFYNSTLTSVTPDMMESIKQNL